MKFAKKTDLLVLAAIAAIGLFAFLFYRFTVGTTAVKAEIYQGSTLVETVPLGSGADRTFSVEGNEQVIFHVYADGSIAFESSDCPDKVCVRSGKLRLAGASAACLPNELILKIVSDGKRAADAPDMIVH